MPNDPILSRSLRRGARPEPAGRVRESQEEERRHLRPRGEDNELPDQAKPAADEKPAAQANDEEKPKVMLELGQEAPKTDSLGQTCTLRRPTARGWAG